MTRRCPLKIVTNLPPGLLSADRPHNYIFWSVSVIVGCTFGEGPGEDGRRESGRRERGSRAGHYVSVAAAVAADWSTWAGLERWQGEISRLLLLGIDGGNGKREGEQGTSYR